MPLGRRGCLVAQCLTVAGHLKHKNKPARDTCLFEEGRRPLSCIFGHE